MVSLIQTKAYRGYKMQKGNLGSGSLLFEVFITFLGPTPQESLCIE